ncbi:Retinol dehydrogenase 13 [Blattella germanica]|nr:Retinol dehydrogenase 13 [Blattella germanica]
MWQLVEILFGNVLCSNAFWLLVISLLGLKMFMLSTIGKNPSNKRIFGKTVLITGPTSGIGRELAIGMGFRGAKVILACRDLKKAEELQEEIYTRAQIPKSRVVAYHLDLSSLASVRKFVDEINRCEDRIDVLINNAGETGLGNRKTSDGLNIGMQVNHFGPFLLTCLLMDKLKQSAPSRVIWVTSSLNGCAKFDVENMNFDNNFSENQVYFCSKLANILVANELAKRVQKSGVTVNTVHPGFTSTKIWQHFPGGVYVLWNFMLQKFFREKVPSVKAQNKVLGIRVFEKSMELVGLQPHEIIH